MYLVMSLDPSNQSLVPYLFNYFSFHNCAFYAINQGLLTVAAEATVLQDELEGVNSRWYQIGVQLGLPVQTLDGYQDVCDSLSIRLRATMKEWLHNTGEYQIPSWQALVDAVEHSAGGANQKLARELAAKKGIAR